MATKNWGCSKDSLFCLYLGSTALGGGADQHMPIGYWSSSRFRTGLQFSLDWTGVVQIVSAVMYCKTTGQVHIGFGSDPDLYVERATTSWTENTAKAAADGGGGWTTSPTVWPGPSVTTDGRASVDVPTGTGGENTWFGVDITAIVEAWAPTSVKKRDGNPGGNAANYGVVLRAVNGDTDSTETTEIWSRESSYDPYIVLTYTTNTAPSAPTNVKVDGKTTGATSIIDTTPTITFTGVDPDSGDVLQKYDIEIDTTTGNGVTPDWASLAWSTYNDTSGISGQNVTKVPGTLSRGQWYAMRCRTYDDDLAQGAWSSTFWFKINSPPTVGSLSPVTGGKASIWNLTEVAAWTSGGSHAKPTLGFTPADVDGNTLTDFAIRIKTSPGGAAVYTATAANWVGGDPLPWAPGYARVVYVNYALVNETTYYWDVQVKDSNGEWSTISSEQSFQVRWGQARYAANPGASSSQWTFSSGAVYGDLPVVHFLFGSAATAAGVPAAWYTSISAAEAAKGTNGYMIVLVRLHAAGPSTATADLPSMTFTYKGSASTPDRWTSVPSGEWTLDSDVRRYGSQSLRCAVQAGVTGNRYVYPFRATAGDDVPVLPETTYTLSAWVKTGGTLTGGGLSVAVYAAGTWGPVLASSGDPAYEGTGHYVYDSAGEDDAQDGWTRVFVRYTTAPGETAIRPMVHYLRSVGVTETFWVDAVQLEEGTVARNWSPGLVGDPVVIDSNGIQVDGSAGGIMRMRGSGGAAADVVELGTHGLRFGGDVDVYRDASGAGLHVDSAAAAASIVLGATGDAIGIYGWKLGDAQYKWYLSSAGLVFGAGGSTAPDVNLYRAAADLLKTDDDLTVMGGNLMLGTTASPAQTPSIMFGADVELYRSAGNVLALASGDRLDDRAVGRMISRTTAQSIGHASWTQLTGFTTGDIVDDGWTTYNSTYAGVQVSAAGVYIIVGGFAIASGSDYTRLLVNYGVGANTTPTIASNILEWGEWPNTANIDRHTNGTWIARLAANDIVGLFAYQQNGAAAARNASSRWLNVWRIGT